jgi:tetratricopeptide (TPR) repeat protein
MNEIEKLEILYDQLYKDEQVKDSETIIQLVEPDLSLIEKTTFENQDDFVKANQILADYAMALQKEERYSESVVYLEQVIIRIENNNISGKELIDEPLYETVLFQRGLARYHLKKYKEAISDFKILVDKERRNTEYKTMHNETVKMIFRKFEWIMVALIVISAAASIYIGKNNMFIYRISYGVLIVVVIGFYVVNFLKKKQMVK